MKEMRPWFWILIAALALVSVGALVLAISAGNETVDQEKLVRKATEQIKGEISGLNQAVDAANELQAESEDRAKRDRRRINRDVEEAVAGGEVELEKLTRRVKGLENKTKALASTDERLEQSTSGSAADRRKLEADVDELQTTVKKLQKQIEGP